MIYVTGDTHGLIDFAKLKRFAKTHRELTKGDYMIILGDFGGVWSPQTLDATLAEYEKLPFSVLFIDGNHENFDMLAKYPISDWHGGKVQFVKKDIIHLMRGQVFEIEGKTFFTFGGATSVDKALRMQGFSWWEQELPSMADYDEACANLKNHNFKVNYVLTHSCDEKSLYMKPLKTPFSYVKVYPENAMLTNFEEQIDYDCWFFGHFHVDGDLTDKKTVLYQDILRIV